MGPGRHRHGNNERGSSGRARWCWASGRGRGLGAGERERQWCRRLRSALEGDTAVGRRVAARSGWELAAQRAPGSGRQGSGCRPGLGAPDDWRRRPVLLPVSHTRLHSKLPEQLLAANSLTPSHPPPARPLPNAEGPHTYVHAALQLCTRSPPLPAAVTRTIRSPPCASTSSRWCCARLPSPPPGPRASTSTSPPSSSLTRDRHGASSPIAF